MSRLAGQLPPAISSPNTEFFENCEAFFRRRSQYMAKTKIEFSALHRK